jgi:hypothetical protein
MLACTGVDYALDDDYEDVLCAEEREAKKVLTRLMRAISGPGWASAAGEKLARCVQSMGGRPTGRHLK